MKPERTKTKLVLSLLALGSTLTFLAFCMAEDPDPGIPSGPVLQSDAQPIPNLPYTISESGSYRLTQNLIHTDESTNAIEVNADNVTIDLGGYSIIGPTTVHNETCSGIYMDGRKNVEIRNGTITNFPNNGISGLDTGVISEASGHRVIDIRVRLIGAHGIILSGSNHTVRDCTVTQTQISIEQGFGAITCGQMSTVIGNVVSENNIVGIRTGGGCMIRDNTLANCTFGIIPESGSSVIDNTISFMVGDGIWIRDVEGCLIKGNTLRGNGRNGINVEAFDSVIEENLVTLSDESGIYFVYPQNVYANNRALFNGTNYGGEVPTGVFDGGGNIGAGTLPGSAP
jgi:parallel beta-helix repeat protein